MHKFKAGLIASAAVYCAFPALLFAQSGPRAEDGEGYGEIVVTAQKREQSLNDVGLAVTAFSGEQLQARGVANLADIANTVPSLSYTNSNGNTPVYTLRGVGFYDTSLSAYPTVSVYLDEVGLPFPALTKHSAFDLQRVEVLKGPQGTLFGQNATGGAINFIAAKPTDVLSAGMQIGYGRFNMLQGEGYISGPISDTVRARLAGRIEHGDAWQTSNSRPGDKLGKTRNYMGRLIIEAQPADALRLSLNLNGWKDKSDPQAAQKAGYLAQNPVENPVTASESFSPENNRASDWTPGLPFSDNRLWQASFRADYDVTDTVTLTSLTAYTDYKQNQAIDTDGSFQRTLDLPTDDGRIKSFSQELRISNGGQHGFRWVVGGNMERSSVDQINRVVYVDGSVNSTLATLGYPVFGNDYTSFQKMRNYAGFANAEFDAGQLTFKAGARYTQANRRVRMCGFDSDPNSQIGRFFYEVLLGGSLGAYPTGSCFVINSDNVGQPVVDYLPFFTPGEYRAKLNQNNLSYRVGVDWKPNQDTLLFANVAKGYKAGSFPTLTASQMQQFAPVTQEALVSYEAGFKLTTLDGSLQLNGTGFYYDYTNKQLKSKLIDPFFGIVDVLQNIPKSSVKGFEIEATARPTRGLVFSASFVYLDASIDKYVGINSIGVAADFAGTRMPFTPKYQASINGDYEFPLSSAVQGFVGYSINYRSDTVSVIGGDINPPGAIPAGKQLLTIADYTLVDLRAGISSGPWRLQIWGKNIFDTYYWNNVVRPTDTIARYAGMPATYGATLSWKY